MTALVFGIGIGLFVLLLLWITAALVFAVSLRTEKRVGAIAIAVAVLASVILVGAPRSSREGAFSEDKPYDRIFVARPVLLVSLALSTLVASLGYLRYGLLETAEPLRVDRWIHR